MFYVLRSFFFFFSSTDQPSHSPTPYLHNNATRYHNYTHHLLPDLDSLCYTSQTTSTTKILSRTKYHSNERPASPFVLSLVFFQCLYIYIYLYLYEIISMHCIFAFYILGGRYSERRHTHTHAYLSRLFVTYIPQENWNFSV